MTTIETLEQQIREERKLSEALQNGLDNLKETKRQRRAASIEKYIETCVEELCEIFPGRIQYNSVYKTIAFYRTPTNRFEIVALSGVDDTETLDKLFEQTTTAIRLILKVFDLKEQLLNPSVIIHRTYLQPNSCGLFEKLIVTNGVQSLDFTISDTIDVNYSWGRKRLDRSFDHEIMYSDGTHISFRESIRNAPAISFNYSFKTTLETLEADVQKARAIAEKAPYHLDVNRTKATVTL